MNASRRVHFVFVAFAAGCALAAGCDRRSRSNSSQSQPEQQLVLYTSVDEPYVRPIVAAFESRHTGVKVLVQTDTEATKSAGLAERLQAERDNPRADVWWGNEVFHTIRLAEAGVLTPYDSPSAKDVAEKFKDGKSHLWAGNGLRARLIAVHSEKPDDAYATGFSLQDLLKPEHRGKVAIARPTAGTTGGHVAALYVLWGPQKFEAFFKALKSNGVKMVGGNGPVAEAIGRGDVDVGLTDNDDVASVRRDGGKIVAGLPDQDADGTLAIPTTVALVAGRPVESSENAKKLVDDLLSAEVERRLIDVKFAGWSVRDPVTKIRTMNVDFAAAAHAMPKAVESAMTILEERK